MYTIYMRLEMCMHALWYYVQKVEEVGGGVTKELIN